MKKKIFPSCLMPILLSGVLFSWAATLDAATIVLNPTLNGNIRESTTSGFGSFGGTGLLAGDTGDGTSRYLNGLFRFDLSTLDPALEIASVSLVLTSRGHGGSESTTLVTFDLYELKRQFSPAANWSNWSATNTWETKGGTGPNDRGQLLSSLTISTADFKTKGTKLEFGSTTDFVSLVEDYLQSETQYLNLWLGLPTGGDTGRHILDLASTNYVDAPDPASYYPQLIITPVPEPGVYALLGVGLALAVAKRRKRPTHR